MRNIVIFVPPKHLTRTNKFRFKTVFDVAPNISLPVTLFLTEQISVSDSSITTFG